MRFACHHFAMVITPITTANSNSSFWWAVLTQLESRSSSLRLIILDARPAIASNVANSPIRISQRQVFMDNILTALVKQCKSQPPPQIQNADSASTGARLLSDQDRRNLFRHTGRHEKVAVDHATRSIVR